MPTRQWQLRPERGASHCHVILELRQKVSSFLSKQPFPDARMNHQGFEYEVLPPLVST